MKKMFTFAATLLVAAPAFAFQPSATGSGAFVSSTQGTQAGAVSGNYTQVTTSGHAGFGGTAVNAKQTNVGGTLAGAGGFGKGGASASGQQISTGAGGSFAVTGGLLPGLN